MKKQSGPFKLKYKKSAFPFMENFHVKKHGKLKIVREDESKQITKKVTRGKISSPSSPSKPISPKINIPKVNYNITKQSSTYVEPVVIPTISKAKITTKQGLKKTGPKNI
jgi:hypothetical protein